MSGLVDAACSRPPSDSCSDSSHDDDAPLQLQESACPHYSRDNQILAACCQRLFWCRVCHDEAVEDHELDRFATEQMACVHCGLLQPVARSCIDPACQDADDDADKSTSLTSVLSEALSSAASAVASAAMAAVSAAPQAQCAEADGKTRVVVSSRRRVRGHNKSGRFTDTHYFCAICRLWDNDT
jgi:hypothetical protein